jgi:hypothetical protein
MEQTLIFKMFSLIFIGAPNNYHTALAKESIDKTARELQWNEMQKKMSTEWDQYILLVSQLILCHFLLRGPHFSPQNTVMFAANVGFLAIGSVMNTVPTGTPCQIFSYLSTMTSIGGVITGLFLLRQNKDAKTATNAVRFPHFHDLYLPY